MIGNPIVPVIKICANPRTVRTMSEHIDVDSCALLQRDMVLDQAGDKLLDMMMRTANGRLTAAEALRVRADPLVRKRLGVTSKSRRAFVRPTAVFANQLLLPA